MYDRFTEAAVKVMREANEQAKRLYHEYIGTEHILLALLTFDSPGLQVISSFKIQPDDIRKKIFAEVKTGPEGLTMGKLPSTPRGKKVIDYAMEEARSMNLNFVGTEHLVLGLLRETEGLAALVLTSLGVMIGDARAVAVKLAGGHIGHTLSKEEKILLDQLVAESGLPLGSYCKAIDSAIRQRRAMKALADGIKELSLF